MPGPNSPPASRSSPAPGREEEVASLLFPLPPIIWSNYGAIDSRYDVNVGSDEADSDTDSAASLTSVFTQEILQPHLQPQARQVQAAQPRSNGHSCCYYTCCSVFLLGIAASFGGAIACQMKFDCCNFPAPPPPEGATGAFFPLLPASAASQAQESFWRMLLDVFCLPIDTFEERYGQQQEEAASEDSFSFSF